MKGKRKKDQRGPLLGVAEWRDAGGRQGDRRSSQERNFSAMERPAGANPRGLLFIIFNGSQSLTAAFSQDGSSQRGKSRKRLRLIEIPPEPQLGTRDREREREREGASSRLYKVGASLRHGLDPAAKDAALGNCSQFWEQVERGALARDRPLKELKPKHNLDGLFWSLFKSLEFDLRHKSSRGE
ncbi:hypothetical protein chiPu_0016455 [Chiloscyllium punctatum]|uniref:Uncharacterized protein n=1 Tax=Chiloscyllium punctatum TaxID=137246 RepID=A0A401T5N7_CHIPU|nr:hypothetical protein [Chiloscyllium punctatum]